MWTGRGRTIGRERSNRARKVAALCEPLLASCKVRHRALNAEPELGRVVGFAQMDQFVHHDVLNDARREQHNAPVEVESVALPTRAPAVAEITDGDAGSARP